MQKKREFQPGLPIADCGFLASLNHTPSIKTLEERPHGKLSFFVFRFRNPQSAIRNSHGFTYTALLAAVVIIGVMLGAATKYWQNVTIRDKEDELLFRGEQYRLAIERYFYAIPGRNQYPQSIDELLKDSRTAEGKRYLRRKYKDPITGKDFVEERDPSRRIIGVYSSSDKEPLKQTNFPATALCYTNFEGKKKYSDWKFEITSAVTGSAVPGSSQQVP